MKDLKLNKNQNTIKFLMMVDKWKEDWINGRFNFVNKYVKCNCAYYPNCIEDHFMNFNPKDNYIICRYCKRINKNKE